MIGDFRLWPISEVAARLLQVSLLRRSGLDLLMSSFSRFDPFETSPNGGHTGDEGFRRRRRHLSQLPRAQIEQVDFWALT